MRMMAAKMEEERANREGKELRKVGRLSIGERQDEAEERLEGKFRGFRKKTPADEGEEKKEGAEDDLDTLEGETLQPPAVAPLETSAFMHYLELQVEQRVAERADARLPTEIVIVEARDGLDAAFVEAAKAGDSERPTLDLTEHTACAAEDTPPEEEEPPKKRRKVWLLLLLVPLVVLAAVLTSQPCSP